MPVISIVAPVITAIVVMIIVICQSIPKNTCSDDARSGDTGIDRLDRTAIGVIGRHAGRAGQNGTDDSDGFDD